MSATLDAPNAERFYRMILSRLRLAHEEMTRLATEREDADLYEARCRLADAMEAFEATQQRASEELGFEIHESMPT